MKKFKLLKQLFESCRKWKTLVLLWTMLLIGAPQAFAWYYIVGDLVGGWDVNNPSAGEMIDHYRSFYRVEPNSDGSPKKYWFKVDKGNGTRSGTNIMDNVSGNVKTGLGGNDSKTMWIEIYEKSDIQFHMTNYDDWKIDVKVTPSWHIKYPWYGETGWKWSGDMYSNGNGTYSTEGNYNSNESGFNYGDDTTEKDPTYSSNTILDGDNLNDGLKCFFTLNMNGTPSLTIQEKNSTAGTNYVFFDNTNAGWSDANIQFVIGHLSHTKTFTMSKLGESDNTNLYYVARSGNDWTGEGCFAYFGMIGKESKYGDGSYGCRNMYDAPHHSEPLYKHLNLQDNYNYLVCKEDNINGNPITVEEKGNGYSALNFNQTVKYQISTNGSAYADMTEGKTPATITGSSFAFNGRTSVTGTSLDATLAANTDTRYSTTINAAYTGKTTLSVSSLRDGYKFKGWYIGSEVKETATSYTYRPTAETIVSARFEERWAIKGTMLSQDFTTENLIGNFVVNGSGQDVGYIDFDLPGNDDFEFKIFDRAADSKAWYSCNDEVFDYADDNGVAKTCTNNESESNMTFHTAAAGRYRFTWNATSKTITVTYPDSYKVTYDENSGTGSVPTDNTYYASGATVTVQGNTGSLEKGGYNALTYWTSAAGSGTEYAIGSGQFTITDNTTLFAKWTQTITLNANGGDSNGSVVVDYNATSAGTPSAPTLSGYEVEGYYAEAGCTNKVMTPAGELVAYTGYVVGGKWVHDGGTELFAKWTASSYDVTLNPDNGGATTYTVSATYGSAMPSKYKDSETSVSAPSKSNYTFAGYYDAQYGGGTQYYAYDGESMSSAHNWDKASTGTLYGKWTQTITLDRDGGTTGSTSIAATFGAPLDLTDYEAPTKDGYVFGGYETGSGYTLIDKDGNVQHVSGVTNSETKAWVNTGEALTIKAKWTAKEYTVTLDRNGGTTGSTSFKVHAGTSDYNDGGEDIVFPSRTGYTFAGYYTTVEGNVQIFNSLGGIVSSVTGYTNGSGHWTCTDEDLTLYAHWTVKKYEITLNDRGATTASSTSTTLKATYNSNELTASITNPVKWGNVFGGWEDEDGALVIGTDGKLIASVTGYTDGSKNWTHDGIVTLYAKWTVDESKTYKWVSGELTPKNFTNLEDGIYRATVTLSKDQTFHLSDGATAAGPSSSCSFSSYTASSSLGTNDNEFEYTGTSAQTVVLKLNLNTLTLNIGHVVFYLGDKEGDSHADVTDYDGYHADLASISGTFEYRLRVNSCTEWSTLYLPFDPTEVTVWGGTSNHHLFPYYYNPSLSQLYQGYYVLRTPTNTDLEIEKFDQWFDPETYNALPVANTPYIVQWRHNYFSTHPYISIWGEDMTPLYEEVNTDDLADDIVRVCGNGSLSSKNIAGAYVLESDYGGGAWLRGANPTDPVSVGPFQCYILASETTTANTLVIKRRTGEDSATDLEDIYNLDRKEVIVVYTISGIRVAQYNDCSFEEAGRHMNSELSEGIYIMNAGNESVKLIIR